MDWFACFRPDVIRLLRAAQFTTNKQSVQRRKEYDQVLEWIEEDIKQTQAELASWQDELLKLGDQPQGEVEKKNKEIATEQVKLPQVKLQRLMDERMQYVQTIGAQQLDQLEQVQFMRHQIFATQEAKQEMTK